MQAQADITLEDIAAELGLLATSPAGDHEAVLDALAAIDWAPALRACSLLLASAARECFDQGRAPDGAAWLPLKRPSKKRGGKSAKPLRDTGLLMASLQPGRPDNVTDVGAFHVGFGTNVAYARFHQEGTRTIPARPFLGWTPALERKCLLILAQHAQKELARLP